MPTTTLAHYELLERLGRGGMGVVYRARDTRLERDVAIKLLPGHVSRDAERRARFLREARAAARLNHPNIATIYEVGEAEAPAGLLGDTELVSGPGPQPVLYLAMELVTGEDLGTRLAVGPLPEDEVVELARQVVQGLDHAHRAGVVHRDMKPHNLRLTPEGVVKILDFGLAKLMAPDSARSEGDTTFLTTEGMILGTAPYMSPEQVQGEGVDARSDLFSFGVVLYQMISGTLPFESGGFVRYVRSLVHTDPRPLSEARPGVSPELERIVSRLLAKDPEARYPSAAAVLADLAELLPETGSRTPGRFRDPLLSGLSRRPSWRRLAGRRLPWAAALLLVVLLGAGVLVLTLLPGTAGPPVTHVAVLPFENQTSNPSLDAYYEGIGTALARKLASVPGVNVVPELDVRRYRDTDKTAEEISRELDVGTLIQGYVQGGDDWVVVDVHLANAAPYMSLWERPFEGDPDDLLLLQERLVDWVLRHLPVSVSARERRRLRENPTASREAWDAYFQGLALLEQVNDIDSLERAVTHFERAVEADPRFAWAHAALSETYWRLARSERDPGILDSARFHAERGVELSPDEPQLRVPLARVARARGQRDKAAEGLRSALELNPNLDQVHRELASTLQESGRFDLAEESLKAAIDLRPSYWQHWNEYGLLQFNTGDYGAAEEAFRRADELSPPGVVQPLENIGTVRLAQDDLTGALEAYERIPDGERTPSLYYNMGTLSFFTGKLDEAERLYSKAVELSPREPAFRTALADVREQLEKPAEAAAEYEKALDLVERLLAADPGSRDKRALRGYLAARLGRCRDLDRTVRELEAGDATVEQSILLARGMALCDRDEAARRVQALLDRGIPAERLQGEIELREYLNPAS